ncbi:MAG: hypothetical protein JXA01_09760, partial [Dehalococcoidia bacterium]|nr:hypothetical protein [Dehalococcoidia bacterium]
AMKRLGAPTTAWGLSTAGDATGPRSPRRKGTTLFGRHKKKNIVGVKQRLQRGERQRNEVFSPLRPAPPRA